MLINYNKIIVVVVFVIFLSSCSDFKPLYREDLNTLHKLQSFAIITDNKAVSQDVKKSLLSLFPTKRKNKYIIKIEAKSATGGTVSDITRKISRYKTKVSASVNLYYRYKQYDKLIFSFEEEKSAPYSLVVNNIRSTLASKKKAQQTSTRLLAEEIYKSILIYLKNN